MITTKGKITTVKFASVGIATIAVGAIKGYTGGVNKNTPYRLSLQQIKSSEKHIGEHLTDEEIHELPRVEFLLSNIDSINVLMTYLNLIKTDMLNDIMETDSLPLAC